MQPTWQVSVDPCGKVVSIPAAACSTLEELKQAVLSASLVVAPELVPADWLDAKTLSTTMHLTVLDGDAVSAESYAELAADRPKLLATCPTAQPARRALQLELPPEVLGVPPTRTVGSCWW